MTNIPKKLNNWTKTKKIGEDYLVLWESVVEIKQKQDEIIDYLESKEEASNYKIVSFDPVGETVSEASKGEGATLKELFKSVKETQKKALEGDSVAMSVCGITSKGECSKCGVKYPMHKGDCPELYPPEHKEREQWQCDLAILMGNLVGPRDVNFDDPLEDFIKERFVSKEKIKIRYNRQRCAECKHVECKELDKFMESLGLGD